jgi:hypothetical protein
MEENPPISRYNGLNNTLISRSFMIVFRYPCFIGFELSKTLKVISTNNINYVFDNSPKLKVNDEIMELLDDDNVEFSNDDDEQYTFKRSLKSPKMAESFVKLKPPNTIINIKFKRKNIKYITSVYKQLIQKK